jgi:hypothetical protein
VCLCIEHGIDAFYQLHAHAAIMIGTFPETGVVVIEVNATIIVDAPVPFAMRVVDKMVLDVLPASQGFVKRDLVVEVLIEVEEAYNGLGLHPPMAVVVEVRAVWFAFINHGTIRLQSLLACLCHLANDRLYLI